LLADAITDSIRAYSRSIFFCSGVRFFIIFTRLLLLSYLCRIRNVLCSLFCKIKPPPCFFSVLYPAVVFFFAQNPTFRYFVQRFAFNLLLLYFTVVSATNNQNIADLFEGVKYIIPFIYYVKTFVHNSLSRKLTGRGSATRVFHFSTACEITPCGHCASASITIRLAGQTVQATCHLSTYEPPSSLRGIP
jgi:hypothetical protein